MKWPKWIERMLPTVTKIEYRSIENPSVPLSAPEDWTFEAFGAVRGDSGERVTVNSAKTLATVSRAVELVAGDIAKLPCLLCRTNTDQRLDAEDLGLFRVLRHQASEWTSANTFFANMQAHAMLGGNAYAFITKEGNTVTALDQIATETVSPFVERGRLRYKVEGEGGEQRVYEPFEILHIRGLGDALMGESKIRKAANSIGYGLAMQKHGNHFFKLGAKPSIILKHPGIMPPDAKKNLVSGVQTHWQGTDNHHKVLLLEQTIDAMTVPIDNESAQFLGSRQFHVREIANWFGIPPHKLGDDSRLAYNSIEQEELAYLASAIEPWLCAWESEMWLKLLSGPMQKRRTHTICFDRSAHRRADLATLASFLPAAVTNGIMNRDEARHMLGLDPIPGGEGEEFMVPLNMDAGGTDEPPEDPANGEADEEAIAALVSQSVRAAALRLKACALKAARTPDTFLEWIDQRMDRDRESVFRALDPGMRLARIKTDEFLDGFYGEWSEVLLNAADAKPEQLRESVERLSSLHLAKIAEQSYGRAIQAHRGNGTTLQTA